MILEFKQTTSSAPGTHTIFLNNDTEVGRITGDPGTKIGNWKITERCRYDNTAPPWDIGRHQFPTLKDAKKHLVRNIKDVYPGLERVR